MSDAFASSRSLITWAKKNTSKLNRRLSTFFRRHGGYEPFAESHPDKPGFFILKVRMKKQLPNDIPAAVKDILSNLRSALDHAVYAVAVTAGTPKPGNAYFPFRERQKTLKGSSREDARTFRLSYSRSFAGASHTREGILRSGHSM